MSAAAPPPHSSAPTMPAEQDRPRWTTDEIGDLDDLVVVVTGANSGLGRCSALALASHGATVVMACRDPDRASAAVAEVAAVATGAAPTTVRLDLADLASVDLAAAQIREAHPRVDVLMNNAGVMAVPLQRTAQGHELQFGTNHLGHFALTARLLPALLEAPAARVVTTSSQAHRLGAIRWDDLDWTRGYRRWPAYGMSKLANLMFAYELDRRARAAGAPLASIAAHPGYASTHLQAVGPEQSGSRSMAVGDAGRQPAPRTTCGDGGAAPAVRSGRSRRDRRGLLRPGRPRRAAGPPPPRRLVGRIAADRGVGSALGAFRGDDRAPPRSRLIGPPMPGRVRRRGRRRRCGRCDPRSA